MIDIKNFATRADLEKEILVLFGNDLIKNKDLKESIVGTTEELARFSLSDQTTVYGIKCEPSDAKDQPAKATLTKKPNRGELFDSKINGIKIK